MTDEQAVLFDRVMAHPLDVPGARVTFAQRLCRDHGWQPAFAARVILEYRRFAFLAAAAGHPVAPSDAVDQAWHQHILFTHDYFEVFCPSVLGFTLHHGPSLGGKEESVKHEDWYARTLMSYETFFGPAPADLWPPTEARFAEKFTRFSRRTHWLLPKPPWRRLAASAAVAAGLLPLAGVVGCVALAERPPNWLDWRGPDFLVLYAALTACGVAAAILIRLLARLPWSASPEGGTEPTPSELAMLAGGWKRVVQTMAAAMVLKGTLTHDKIAGAVRPADAPGAKDTVLEKRIHAAVRVAGGLPLAQMHQKIDPDAAFDQALIESRCRPTPAQRFWGRVLPVLLFAGLLALGVAKIAIGLGRGKPVGFLMAMAAVALLLAIGFGMAPIHSTLRGVRQVNAARRRRKVPVFERKDLAGDSLLIQLAIFGPLAIEGTVLGAFAADLRPPRESSSFGDSGSSGCTSSGCSSGGGGCGGSGCGGCGGGGD